MNKTIEPSVSLSMLRVKIISSKIMAAVMALYTNIPCYPYTVQECLQLHTVEYIP